MAFVVHQSSELIRIAFFALISLEGASISAIETGMEFDIDSVETHILKLFAKVRPKIGTLFSGVAFVIGWYSELIGVAFLALPFFEDTVPIAMSADTGGDIDSVVTYAVELLAVVWPRLLAIVSVVAGVIHKIRELIKLAGFAFISY